MPSDCRKPGEEYLRFSFSQAVRDIHATFRFLRDSPQYAPRKIVLVTFSISSIDGRKAVATDPTGLVAGWVNVVGVVDLHSALRSASGGVDYAYGLLNGVRFGQHEIAGVLSDMEYTGRDALDNGLAFLEDARRDMAAIRIPITWLHGRHDGWMDLPRVQRLMASGHLSGRRLVELPIGHQLRNSREAIETFQLVASEVGRMSGEAAVRGRVPNLTALEHRLRAEHARRPPPRVDTRSLWRDYLIGRDGNLGMEFMTATRAYREMMARQVDWLQLTGGERIVDLGSGTGDLALHFAADPQIPRPRAIVAVDFVREALIRGRERLKKLRMELPYPSLLVTANLELARDLAVPFASRSFDAALASLLISYVDAPQRLLREMFGLLRPGGRLVVSSLKRDADVSKLYMEGAAELEPARVREMFGSEAEREFDRLQRDFLNAGARVIQLEEAGRFRFWDGPELAEEVRKAGFTDVRVSAGWGSPPQAVIVRARRPEAEGSRK